MEEGVIICANCVIGQVRSGLRITHWNWHCEDQHYLDKSSLGGADLKEVGLRKTERRGIRESEFR